MSKYNARKVVIDGKEFDSAKEGRRYQELLLLQKAGKISDLETQKRYELIPAQYEMVPRYGKRGTELKPQKKCLEKALAYIADFVYTDTDTGETVVEDVKGYRGGAAYQLYSIKRKLMLYTQGIRIREV